MKEEKEILFEGKRIKVSQCKHWHVPINRDTPSKSEINAKRFSIVKTVRQAWESLSVAPIRSLLDESFSYSSYWVQEAMHGAATYLDYLHGKFLAIQKSDSQPSISLVFIQESLLFPAFFSYALFLNQNGIETLLLIWFKDDKICELFMTDPDLFTFEKYNDPSECLLDGNGEPLIIKHSCPSDSRLGKKMAPEELQTFACKIIADIFTRKGATIESTSPSRNQEKPDLIMRYHNQSVYVKAVPFFSPQTDAFAKDLKVDALWANEARKNKSRALYVTLGLFCVETDGENGICGGSFTCKLHLIPLSSDLFLGI